MRRNRGTAFFLVSVLMAVLFMAGACGRKGYPVAPEDYHPPKEKQQDAADSPLPER